MKNPLKIALVASAAALLLSGCGLVNSLVPDQSVTNAYGLDDRPVELSPVPSGTALASAAVATLYEGSLSASFDDVVLPDSVPAGIRPSSLEEELQLGSSVTITAGAGATLPATLTIEGVTLAVSVDDASDDPVATEELATDLSIVLTQESCLAGVCTYTVTSADAGSAETLLILAVAGAAFDELWTLLQNGVERNSLTGTMTLEFDQAFDASSIEIVLQTTAGTLKFG